MRTQLIIADDEVTRIHQTRGVKVRNSKKTLSRAIKNCMDFVAGGGKKGWRNGTDPSVHQHAIPQFIHLPHFRTHTATKNGCSLAFQTRGGKCRRERGFCLFEP